MVPVITFLMALPLGYVWITHFKIFELKHSFVEKVDHFYLYYRLETVNIKCSSGKAKVLGTVVCVAGATLLTLYRGMPLFDHSDSQAASQMMDHAIRLNSAKKTQRWTIGSVALVVGTLFWSSWFLLQSTIGKRYPCQYSSTAIMSFFGAIQSAALSFATSRNFSAWVLKGKIEIITVLYAVSIPYL